MVQSWGKFFAALLLVNAVGCSSEVDDTEGSGDDLRTDPNGVVPTADASIRVLSGYNAFLDRAVSMPCVVAKKPVAASVGDVRGEFYLRHVTSKQDLAKELDVDVGASLKVPQSSASGSAKFVKSFKSSSTTVTFLARAVRSYVVSDQSRLELTPQARGLLEQNKMGEFLQKCGGSFAKNIRYEADVVALLQFEASSEEAARSIAAALGGATPEIAQPIAGGKLDLKTKAEQTASKFNASLSVTVSATGFVSAKTKGTSDVAQHSFEKFDELREEMAASFEADLAKDRADYATNQGRNVRPAVVGQASYSQLPDAPAGADFGGMTKKLASAEEFFRDVAGVQLRMETVYQDEVGRFLSDTKDQFRYNLMSKPKLRTEELVPIAQEWATKFNVDDGRPLGKVVAPLRLAIERCVSEASTGDFKSCANDAKVKADKSRAEAELAEYQKRGRIVRIATMMPAPGAKVSARNADPTCLQAQMRLPKRDEVGFLGPAVIALASPSGEIWVAPDESCKKPFFQNGAGQGTFGCADNITEPAPFVQDKPVLCVAQSGPVAVRNTP